MKRISVIIFFLVLISCSVDERRYYNLEDGTWEWEHENGQIKESRNIVNGREHGIQTDFYPNGTIKFLYTMKNGTQYGEESRYHENGVLAGTGNFNYGKAEGLFWGYYKNGNLSHCLLYKAGKEIKADKDLDEESWCEEQKLRLVEDED